MGLCAKYGSTSSRGVKGPSGVSTPCHASRHDIVSTSYLIQLASEARATRLYHTLQSKLPARRHCRACAAVCTCHSVPNSGVPYPGAQPTLVLYLRHVHMVLSCAIVQVNTLLTRYLHCKSLPYLAFLRYLGSTTGTHANLRTTTRNWPLSVLGFCDKHTVICTGPMPYRQDFPATTMI